MTQVWITILGVLLYRCLLCVCEERHKWSVNECQCMVPTHCLLCQTCFLPVTAKPFLIM